MEREREIAFIVARDAVSPDIGINLYITAAVE
jgi:hypothetical protein